MRFPRYRWHFGLFQRLGLRETCSCGKVIYETKEEAAAEAKKLKKRYKFRLMPQQCRRKDGCEYTSGWHIVVDIAKKR